MNWSADRAMGDVVRSVLLTLAALPGLLMPAPLAAQAASLDAVRADIAARWNVPSTAVEIEPDSATSAQIHAGATLRLGAAGTDGRFILFVNGSAAWIRAGARARVPVAARMLARGAAIDTASVRIETRVRPGPPAPLDTVVTGWVATRPLAAGSVLAPPAVKPPVAVRAGAAVTLQVQRGAVQLELPARAAGTGSVGDTILVRTATARRVQAVIRSAQHVRLLTPPEAT